MTFTIPTPKDQLIPGRHNGVKIAVLLTLLGATFWSADTIARFFATTAMPGAVVAKWAAIAALAVFAAMLLIGMAVLAHDAVHRVLFRSPFWNEFWGGLLSALALIPFHANRQFHLTHHGYAHQPGLDPEEAMHRRSFLYAMTVGSFVGLKEQYRLWFANIARSRDPRRAARALKDAAALSAAAALYFIAVPALGLSIWNTVMPTIFAFPLVFAVRALSDHYGIPATVRDTLPRAEIVDTDGDPTRARRDRRREVSGWVVLTAPWLEWLWSGVNYHEVHHKYPWLSHRYLAQTFTATRTQHPYLIVHGYWRSLRDLRHQEYYPSAKREAKTRAV